MLLLFLPAPLLRAQSDSDGSVSVNSGTYSLSDELGGFRLRSASGNGLKADPLAVSIELASASPVTLVIRSLVPVQKFGIPGEDPMGLIYFHVSALNNGGHAWIEFELELQEILGKPSDYGDGLSFDQRRSDSKAISSDRFVEFSCEFEPYDRLLFRNGRVDPLDAVSFSFLVTDFTPTDEFYLVLDPRIPSS